MQKSSSVFLVKMALLMKCIGVKYYAVGSLIIIIIIGFCNLVDYDDCVMSWICAFGAKTRYKNKFVFH